MRCLSGILDALPHFNYISDVLQVLVPKLAADDARMRACAADSIALLLKRGIHGEIMVEAVQLIADMVRTRKCACHPAAVRCLLVLDFKDIGRDDVQKGAPLRTLGHRDRVSCVICHRLHAMLRCRGCVVQMIDNQFDYDSSPIKVHPT